MQDGANMVGRLIPFSVVAFLGFLAVGLPLPTFSLYVPDRLHFSTVAVGVIVGLQSLATLLTRQYAGRLSDTRGPKPAALLGLIGASITGCLYLVSSAFAAHPALSLMLLCAARLVRWTARQNGRPSDRVVFTAGGGGGARGDRAGLRACHGFSRRMPHWARILARLSFVRRRSDAAGFRGKQGACHWRLPRVLRSRARGRGSGSGHRCPVLWRSRWIHGCRWRSACFAVAALCGLAVIATAFACTVGTGIWCDCHVSCGNHATNGCRDAAANGYRGEVEMALSSRLSWRNVSWKALAQGVCGHSAAKVPPVRMIPAYAA